MPRNRPTTRLVALAALCLLAGCLTPKGAREQADQVTDRIVEQAQKQTLGRTEPISIRSPEETLRKRLLLDQALPVSTPASMGVHAIARIEELPDDGYFEDVPTQELPPWHGRAGEGGLRVSLPEALQVAARNSRNFQLEKEKVYLAALALDLERDAFRGTWTSTLQNEAVADLTGEEAVSTLDDSAELRVTKKFQNGIEIAAGIGINLVRLLTGTEASSLGRFADASITIPLLRGAGSFVVGEPLRQSERDVIYAIYTFERFKQQFAVDVSRAYLSVLEQLDAAKNTEESYRRLIGSTRRARRLADAGRLPEIQVDQARQDELRARDRWIATLQQYGRRLDEFRVLLGLPPDATVEPDPGDLERLVADAAKMPRPPKAPGDEAAGPADEPVEVPPPDREHRGKLELDEAAALKLALERRLDLRVAIGRIDDAQRKIAVAADGLLPDLTLLGQANVGERIAPQRAGDPNSTYDPEHGIYTGVLTIDPAFERTAERNDYRTRLIDLEKAVRAAQEIEDQSKSQVRETLRTLLTAREAVRTQERSVELARRRVESTDLFMQAGRAEVRDVLEAQESLVSAENALTSALVRYRLAEIEMQRDLGVLDVTADGLWKEFDPTELPR